MSSTQEMCKHYSYQILYTLKEACRRHVNHKLKKSVVDMQTSFTSDTAYVEGDVHISFTPDTVYVVEVMQTSSTPDTLYWDVAAHIIQTKGFYPSTVKEYSLYLDVIQTSYCIRCRRHRDAIHIRHCICEGNMQTSTATDIVFIEEDVKASSKPDTVYVVGDIQTSST